MTKLTALRRRWMQSPEFKEAYEELRLEFELAKKLIEARTNSGLSQEELAQRMNTSQSAIARLEGGASLPSLRSLAKFAEATNTEIEIHLKPTKQKKDKVAA